MVQVILVLEIFVLILFGYSSELELNSEESLLPKQLNVVVPFGKRLKLNVKNFYNPSLLWRFNGGPVSEKCEAQTTPEESTLTCTDMHWLDAGLYEYGVINTDGQKEALLAVDVKVAECTEEMAAKQRIELVEMRRCFCSGISDNCSMADDLFRSKITARLSESDTVDLKITEAEVRESWNVDSTSELSSYYSLPKELKGNLLKSYGGYIDYPSTDDEIDEDKPDLVLQGKSRTLIYFDKRERQSNDDLNRNRVQITEHNWRQLNNSAVSRNTLLTVLSNVKAFYVKSNQYRSYEPIQIELDSADIEDHGLGKVSTVEKCKCRPGYKGLSCESCSRGFIRRHAVLEQGVCVSIRAALEPLASQLHERLNQIRKNTSKA